ncbi:hypothetical protein ACXET9_01445 [Brachybacterium sp. DNPG3]
MRQRILVLVLLLITAAYAWGLGWIAWGFSRAGGLIGWGLAAAVAALLILTVWVTWREVLFGIAAGRLARIYRPDAPSAAADGAGPAAAEPKAAERAEFEAARAAIEDGREGDWQAWFRLALAYDALRDRRNARMATRRAIDVSRS